VSAETGAALTADDYAEQERTLRSFGERLRATREGMEVSQETLERRACLPQGMVSKFERAAQGPPGLYMVLRLADGLRVEPGVLLDGLPVPRRETTTLKTLAIIYAKPGIKVKGVAAALGIKASYAHRQILRLVSNGSVVNDSGGWIVAEHPEAGTPKNVAEKPQTQ
jgi:transcriptional regulator with XRE-family HTH domain